MTRRGEPDIARKLLTLQLCCARWVVKDDDDRFQEKIILRDFSTLPVVDPEISDKLVGMLTRRDILGAYDKAVIKKTLFREQKKEQTKK